MEIQFVSLKRNNLIRIFMAISSMSLSHGRLIELFWFYYSWRSYQTGAFTKFSQTDIPLGNESKNNWWLYDGTKSNLQDYNRKIKQGLSYQGDYRLEWGAYLFTNTPHPTYISVLFSNKLIGLFFLFFLTMYQSKKCIGYI